MTNSQQIYTLEQGDPERPPTGRPVVYATQGVISSGHYLTSMAGMRMLLDGGNAFDAVAAAAFAAAVVEPIASYSLAAEGVFMLYHAESGDLLSLSGQGTAPGKATIEFYESLGLDEIPTGPGDQAHLSFTVPGIVDALLSLVERYGTRTLAEVLAPSIHYAERGIPNYEYMLERMKNAATRRQFELYPPGGTSVFYDDGDLPAPGSVLVQPGLVDVFKRMVAAESAASGYRREGIRAARDAFYCGDIARTIVECAQSVGGVLSLEDLAGYHAEYEQPVATSFHGYDVYGQSTWTQGAVLHQTLNILERFDLRSMGHNSAQYVQHRDRGAQAGSRGQGGALRRSQLLHHPGGRSAVQAVRGGTRGTHRPVEGDARPAARGRPVAPLRRIQTPDASSGAGRSSGRRRRRRQRHHPRRRSGPRRQHGLCNAERGRLRQVCVLR